VMARVDDLAKEVRKLSPEALRAFRRWFLAFDAGLWDEQLEGDVKAGRPDASADEALAADAEARFQADAWSELSGAWQSDLEPREEAERILGSRTDGRKVEP
jgi:hypothetical protein